MIDREQLAEALAAAQLAIDHGLKVKGGTVIPLIAAARALLDQGDALVIDTPINPDIVGWAIAIISNVSEGDWSKQPAEWQEAARKWLDAAHMPALSDRSDTP